MSAETYRRATPPRQSSTLHRRMVSSRTFNELDNHVWRLTYKWAKFRQGLPWR